jgi:hypothetical protein
MGNTLTFQDVIKIATFMDYPTPSTKGKITESLAKKLYNDWESIMKVADKVDQIGFPSQFGNYAVSVNIGKHYTEITISRMRQNFGFKDGVFDSYSISESGTTKKERTIKAIISFLDSYQTFKPF